MNSALFETATCISVYILVMWVEFSPVFMEKLGLHVAKQKLNRVLFFFIALGTVLPMMHQSSIGTLLVLMGSQVSPLWQTPMVPLLYLLTAIIMGYAVVLFESCIASVAERRKIEVRLLQPMSKVMLGLLAAYLVVRLLDLLMRGALGNAFAFNLAALFFWFETVLFVLPLVLIGSAEKRREPARLFLAGVALMLGGSVLRLNGYLIGYDTGPGWSYFPSISELIVTLGMFAVEVLGYIIITRRFPVLPREVALAH